MSALVGHQASTYVFMVYGGGGKNKEKTPCPRSGGWTETFVEKSKEMN